MFTVKRTGRNKFQLMRNGRRIGTAKSQKDARDIARKLWYAQSMTGRDNDRSHIG